MTVQRVENLSFEQVEYLESRVTRAGEQIVAARMKRNRVDRLRVARVVLYELVGSNVPDFDGRVGRTGRDEGRARVERHRLYEARVFVERVHTLLRVAVPQFYRLVVRRGHDQTSIFRKS